MYMVLWLLLILPPVESDDQLKINETVYIEKGATLVDLSCGEVPQSALAIEWFIYKNNEWIKLVKFYHTKPGSRQYFNDSTKYDNSGFANTSLVVKNIQLTDSAWFKCSFAGTEKATDKRYTFLQVVGKTLIIYLFASLTLVGINMSGFIKVLVNIKDFE